VKLTKFPTLEECLMLHQALLKRFGGQSGVRDHGLLESALARPRSGYYTSLSEQAAALMQSLALNHCFVDGNKRVAFAMTAIFLKMNGWRFVLTADEGETFLIGRVIEAKADFQEIANWIEGKMKA
jgi:death on curing protein